MQSAGGAPPTKTGTERALLPPGARRMSVWRRRGRRRRHQESLVLPPEDPCDMDVETGADSVEQLARKYMRKCTVDSSTESESDINNESSTSIPTQGSLKIRDDLKAHFLDPYDGDSEETSTHSDCSLTNKQPPACMEIPSLTCSMQRCTSLEDLSSIKDEEDCLRYSINCASPLSVTNDVFMQPVMDLEVSFDNPCSKSWSCSTEVVPPSEFSIDSGVVSDASHFHSGQFVLVDINTARSTELLEDAVKAALHQPKLTSGSSGERTASKSMVEKRKQGFAVLDCGGEKIKRKKQRVTETKQ